MKRLYVTAYRYREGLDEADLRELTKTFATIGASPGVLEHFTRLDGQGGFVVQEAEEDPVKNFEITIRYAPWMTFDVYPVMTIEDAFPIIQSVYG